MPALRAPAIVVRHRKMPSSSRHPRLGTGRLERRSSSLRPAPALAVTVHLLIYFLGTSGRPQPRFSPSRRENSSGGLKRTTLSPRACPPHRTRPPPATAQPPP